MKALQTNLNEICQEACFDQRPFCLPSSYMTIQKAGRACLRNTAEGTCVHYRPEYSTWAGMIVTQYGRIPGDHNRAGNALNFGADEPPKHSAALDQLQRYYGTGDTSSEPGNFRPGAALQAFMDE